MANLDQNEEALARLRDPDAWSTTSDWGAHKAASSLASFLDTPQASCLDLSDCTLRALPDALQHLPPRLKTLSVATNRLRVLPDWIGDLGHLEMLALGDNALQALPDSLGNLVEMRDFDCGDVPLGEAGLPEWLRNFKHLESLSCSACKLTSLPDWLAEFEELVYLGCSVNRLTGFPASLGECPKLDGLRYDNDYDTLEEPWKSLHVEGALAVQTHILEHLRDMAATRRVKAARS